jgi:hypothetical protein
MLLQAIVLRHSRGLPMPSSSTAWRFKETQVVGEFSRGSVTTGKSASAGE